jgi:hypothetical protein
VRLPAAVLAVTGLALLAAGCGGSKKPSPAGATTAGGDAAATVRAAEAKTSQAGSDHLALVADVSIPGQHAHLSGVGDFDTASSRGSMTLSMGLAGAQVQLDEVLDGQTVYVSSDLLSAVLPSGKRWLKVDLATAGSTFGIDASALNSQDPTALLAQTKALVDVTTVGTAIVGGVSTTRYHGRIDPAKLPAANRKLIEQTHAKLSSFDVWVGDDGYVHRVRAVGSATSNGKNAKTIVTATLSKFGETVSVSVPGASQSVDASKLQIPGLSG